MITETNTQTPALLSLIVTDRGVHLDLADKPAAGVLCAKKIFKKDHALRMTVLDHTAAELDRFAEWANLCPACFDIARAAL